MKLALKGGGKIRKKPFFRWPMFDQCEENVPTESEKGPQGVIEKIISLIDNLVYSEALISGKTSTGFGTGGVTIHDIELMYETVGPRLGVKAAGGVRSLETALGVIRAGATRIGATATEKIMESWIKFQAKTS